MTRIIRTASATPGPTRFRLWEMISEREQDEPRDEMRRRGYLDWSPDDVIEVETSEEIGHLMQSNQGVLIGGKREAKIA
jgi:hypothetical protein